LLQCTHHSLPCLAFSPSSFQALRFCVSKCFRNFKLRRNPRKIRWTKAFRKAHGKDMAVDSTFDFERRRHRPVKYDRELMGATLRAMKRVEEIRLAREARFKALRFRLAAKQKKEEALREIKEGIDLIMSPLVRQGKDLNQDELIRLANEVSDRAKANKERARLGKKAIAMGESDDDDE
jgi:large subunit ribosomal protein L24e